MYAQYKVAQPSGWLVFKEVAAIDGRKLGEVQGKLSAGARRARQPLASKIRKPRSSVSRPKSAPCTRPAIQGDRETLVADAVIPSTMAVIYLGLLVYFRSIGGYKVVKIRE